MLWRPQESLPNDDVQGAIKKKIDADYAANQAIWQVFWTEATLDTRLEAGDTSLMADLNQQLPNNNRGSWYFNRVRPLCNMVSGYQRRNRKSTIVVPLENGDQKTADQFTKVLLNIYKREGIYETISEAFHQGACISGLNLLQVYMDYKNDPVNGDIKVDNCAYNSFFIDPYFRKTDLSDCAFVWKRSFLSHTSAAALMPDKYEEIMALSGNPAGTARDHRFQYMPEAYGQTLQNKLAYDEYYYRSYRKQRLFVDKNTGETQEISTQSDPDIALFLQHYPEISIIEQDVPTVRMAIMIQEKVFYDGPNNLNIDSFPFVPVLGYYNPMMPYFYSRIQGICRSLRDPQILMNRRIILSADMLESQVNSGWIFKENAVIDVKHLFQTGQGRIIPLKDEAQMTDIMPIQPPQIPPSFFQLQDTFSKELNLVSGINEELMGSALDDKAGILSALRQGAGLTTLQPIFDRLDYSQNLLGELIMKTLQNNYTPGKIKNILEGEEPAPLFYNKAFGKYHCMIEEGYDTQSQKQMAFAQKMQLREMGIAITDEDIIESATFQNKDKTIERMQAMQQQQQQMQQQQMQVQEAVQKSQIELAQARAKADMGLFVERASRVEENRALAVQKMSEANKNDEQALLEKVKILKEIEDMDIGHIERLLNIANSLKMAEQATVKPTEPLAAQSVSEQG